jgi:hypothetical protein
LTAETARAAESSVPQFQKGDRVCFIGDSISHDGAYPSYVYLFYATRFPDRRWEISNAGLGGDTAGGAVKRFDWDIAVNKPTVATILLGMNDVNRGLYGPDKRGAEIEKQRQSALDTYTANMRKLAGLLEQADCRIVFLTPSSFDQTAGSWRWRSSRASGMPGRSQLLGEMNTTPSGLTTRWVTRPRPGSPPRVRLQLHALVPLVSPVPEPSYLLV